MKRELRELIIMLTDAYKLFHRQMYPKNTIKVYSNGTARSSAHYKGNNKDEVIVFGSQKLVRLLKDKFQEFFDLPEEEVIGFCKEQLSSFTGTDYDVEHIRYLHRLQYLPLVVKSLPEGTKCPIRVPYMTFYNTNPKCFWLTNYLETFISTEIWHFITNATIANEYKEIFDKYAMKTVGNTDAVKFQGHDFSARGDYGFAAATAVGLAHGTAFAGGDNVASYLDAQYYYDAPQNNWETFDITQTSVPASEHSVQCAYFNPEDGNELAYLDAMLDEFEDAPVLSIVCDGYDFYKFITEVVPLRKDKIMNRGLYESTINNETFTYCVDEKGKFLYYRGVNANLDAKQMRLALKEGTIIHTPGKVVFRPDSGNIVDIICGDDSDHLGTSTTDAEQKGAIECLWDIFGGTTTEKGYRLLDSHVGLIYGDSVTIPIADEVCKRLEEKNFTSINWVAGIGSYTYQFNTRDSHGQAIKATYVEFQEGDKVVGKNIFKDPKTGDGIKKSAKGLLSVGEICTADGKTPPKYVLKDQCTWEEEESSLLQTIFKDGHFYNQTTLTKIREKIKSLLIINQ